MPEAEPAEDALESPGTPVPEDAAPESAPAEPDTTAVAAGVAAAMAADDPPADADPAGEAAESEPDQAPNAADSVEKVLSNAAMDKIFDSDDEPEAGDDAAGETDDGNAEDAIAADAEKSEEIPKEWTTDEEGQAAGFPPPGAPDAPPQTETDTATDGKRHRGIMRLVSLLALILVISTALGIGYFMQSKIVMHFPATSKIYAMVGLKPDVLGQGLHIDDPKPTKEIDGNDEILVVNGAIKNTTGDTLTVPLLRGALLDKDGKELHIWTFTAQQESVEPGEQVIYRTQFKNPPAAAEKLDITFTRPDDAQTAEREAATPDKN